MIHNRDQMNINLFSLEILDIGIAFKLLSSFPFLFYFNRYQSMSVGEADDCLSLRVVFRVLPPKRLTERPYMSSRSLSPKVRDIGQALDKTAVADFRRVQKHQMEKKKEKTSRLCGAHLIVAIVASVVKNSSFCSEGIPKAWIQDRRKDLKGWWAEQNHDSWKWALIVKFRCETFCYWKATLKKLKYNVMVNNLVVRIYFYYNFHEKYFSLSYIMEKFY